MSEPSPIITGAALGAELLNELKGIYPASVRELSEQYAAELYQVVADLGTLALRHAAGEDVIADLAHAQAAMANWGYASATVIRQGLLTAAQRVAGRVLEALGRALVWVVMTAIAGAA